MAGAEVANMISFRWLLAVLLLGCWPLAAAAQKTAVPSEAIVIYKDRFTLKGRVNEKVSRVIFDPASGRSFSLPSGEFFIDDRVRNVLFSSNQIQKVVELKAGQIKPQTVIVRIKSYSQTLDVNPTWEIENLSEWTKKGGIVQVSEPMAALTCCNKLPGCRRSISLP